METKIDLGKVKRIHFVGAGGISMSALLKIAKSKGKICSGSDCGAKGVLKTLKQQKIKVYTKHKAKNVLGADLVVYSSAISKDNVEILKAKELNIKTITRAEFLGLVAKEYKTVVAISGSHGKTTTTAMISSLLLRFGLSPTVHLGGNYSLISGNLKLGGNDFFVTEACEFRDSFLSLNPTISVITNIEREHLDYFKNFKNIKESFNKFIENTSEVCFINYNYLKYVLDRTKVVTFGLNKNADFRAINIKNKNGLYGFDCINKGEFLGRVELSVEGKHSILNALSSIAVGVFLGIPFRDIAKGLEKFRNVDRRFEKLGEVKGATVIHDYAHHPTEIRSAIKTCLELKKDIVCVFQPHTYSRTKSLLKSFRTAFWGVKSLVLVETYSAREKFDKIGSCENLKTEIESYGGNPKVYGVFKNREVVKFLSKLNIEGKILLFLGAGDIELIAKKFKTKFIS